MHLVGEASNPPLQEKKTMVYIINKTTRDADFDLMEERGRKGKQIDKIYRQTKDTRLEEARRELIRAHQRGDRQRVRQMEDLISQGKY